MGRKAQRWEPLPCFRMDQWSCAVLRTPSALLGPRAPRTRRRDLRLHWESFAALNQQLRLLAAQWRASDSGEAGTVAPCTPRARMRRCSQSGGRRYRQKMLPTRCRWRRPLSKRPSLTICVREQCAQVRDRSHAHFRLINMHAQPVFAEHSRSQQRGRANQSKILVFVFPRALHT